MDRHRCWRQHRVLRLDDGTAGRKGGSCVRLRTGAETFARLEENRRLNDLPQLWPVNHALWNERRTLTFSSRRSTNTTSEGIRSLHRRMLCVRTHCAGIPLDDFANEAKIGRVDAIKMDIEGAERFALEGGREIVARDLPVFLLEVSTATCARAGHRVQDLWNFFRRLRLSRLSGRRDRRGQWLGPRFSDIQQSNVILLPPNRSYSIGAWNEKGLLSRLPIVGLDGAVLSRLAMMRIDGLVNTVVAQLSRTTASTTFIAEVDGLRCVAISMVVVHHLSSYFLAYGPYVGQVSADYHAYLFDFGREASICSSP